MGKEKDMKLGFGFFRFWLVYVVLLFFPLSGSWEIVGKDKEVELGFWVFSIQFIVYCSVVIFLWFVAGKLWEKKKKLNWDFGFP